MNDGSMVALMAGGLAMGYFVAGLFFLRFYKETRDRLFGIFAAAFWLLASQRVALVLLRGDAGDSLIWVYVVRLFAFLLIIFAILDKNRARTA